MQKVRTKAELMRQMRRFFADHDRGISVALFADLCGVSESLLKKVFISESEPMSERLQIRADKALNHYMNGEVAIMRNRYNGKKRVTYRENPEPKARRTYQLTVNGGEIKLKVGLKARGDYTDPTLDELLK